MSQTKICRYCGNVIFSYAETCEYCGRYLYKESENKAGADELCCAKCKAPVNEDDNFCQHCGAVFNLVSNEEEDTDSFKHNINGIHYNIGILLTSLAVSITLTFFSSTGKSSTFGDNLAFFSIVFIAAEVFLYIYFLPSILAIENNKSNAYLVYICNLLLGITIIGWFVALGLTLSSKKKH